MFLATEISSPRIGVKAIYFKNMLQTCTILVIVPVIGPLRMWRKTGFHFSGTYLILSEESARRYPYRLSRQKYGASPIFLQGGSGTWRSIL
uniref:Uncharacterized protein n=1 Tax=mine drainage metagenome TaxID=410659 RepID=E6QKZ2_9ZZZZ